jgi:hypothetical protein
MKGVCIAHNFGEKAKAAALGTAFAFTMAWSGEVFLHCRPDLPPELMFVKSCWSMDLPSHIPATAVNTVAMNVLLPSAW